MSEIDAIALSKTAAHTLQAAVIQCRNPAATQCRETNAEGKNSSIPLHAATWLDSSSWDDWSVGKNSSKFEMIVINKGKNSSNNQKANSEFGP